VQSRAIAKVRQNNETAEASDQCTGIIPFEEEVTNLGDAEKPGPLVDGGARTFVADERGKLEEPIDEIEGRITRLCCWDRS